VREEKPVEKVVETKAAPATVAPKAAASVEQTAVKPKVIAEPVKTAAKPEGKKPLSGKVLNITLVKSGIGYSKKHKATLKALGFRHLQQTIQHVDSLSLRGMLAKVNHLVRIEEQGKK
jgi:large subunit ribosomal protein L30